MVKSYQIKIKFSDVAAEILLMGGFCAAEGKKTSNFHSHQYTECHLVTRGSVELEMEDRSIRLAAGEMCILPKLFNHSIRRISEDAENYSFLFNFSRVKGKGGGMYERLHAHLERPGTAAVKMPAHFGAECRKILKAMGQSGPEGEIRLEALFALLFLDMEEAYGAFYAKKDARAEAVRGEDAFSAAEAKAAVNVAGVVKTKDTGEAAGAAEPQGGAYLWTIEDYIQRHYMEDIRAEDLAAHLHLSSRQAERIVRKNAGQSFGELLLKQRMWAARELLRDTAVPISEIPARVGFKSYSGFFSSVKKFWGMSPQALREEQQAASLF